MAERKKKPKFLRPNYGRSSRSRIKGNWRRPRGIDNKKRVKMKYMGCSPSIGYSQAKEIRYNHPQGMKEVLVHNVQELANAKECVVRIAGGVGRKLKLKLVEEATKRKLHILNPASKIKEVKENTRYPKKQ